MSIGDGRLYRGPSRLYPAEHYPEATAVPTVLRGALENAYAYPQLGGRLIGTWVQGIDHRDDPEPDYYIPVLTGDVLVASFSAYIPEHWDRVTAHVVWYGGTPLTQWKVSITLDGTWQTPPEELEAWPDDALMPGIPRLYEWTLSEPVPEGIAVPGTHNVLVYAGGPNAELTAFGPYAVTVWGDVDEG